MKPLSVFQNNYLKKTLILLGGLFIIYLRYPLFLLEPRFWAEEGKVYFAYAYNHPWYDALFAPHEGYYALFPNIAAIFASLVNLKDAPLVTTFLAFTAQMIPLSIILYGKSSLWDTLPRKIVIVLIIIFTSLSAEIWLNTANSQFFFSLITFLILMEDNAGGFKKWCYRILLGFSGLTGVVSCFLIPVFLIKAWKGKNREHYIQTGILLSAAAMQVIAVLSAFDADKPDRFMTTSLPVILSIIYTKTIVLPFAGFRWASVFATKMKMLLFSNKHEFAVFGYIFFFLIVLFIVLVFQGKERGKQMMILGSYCLLTLLSIFASLGDKSIYIDTFIGGRYFYVPSVILIIFIYSNIDFSGGAVRMARSVLCVLLITASIITGAIVYKPSVMFVANESWPRWSEEVEKWEKNGSYILMIWPQYGDGGQWGIKLRGPSQSR